MRLKRFRHALVDQTVFLISSLSRFLPFPVTRSFCGMLGTAAYYLVRQERRKALRNLAFAYDNELSEQEQRKIARGVFRNYGYGAAEFLQFSRGEKFFQSLQIEVEGREHFDWAVREGKGCVFVTAHAGNWELLAAWLARAGYPVNVVARPAKHSNVQELLRKHREIAGVKVFARKLSTMAMVRVLHRAEGLGILADVDTRVDGIFVDFFGQPAFTPTGPARLAAKTGAPLMVGFIARVGPRAHRIVARRPIRVVEGVPASPDERDIPGAVRYYTQEVERWVRRYPDQWIWTHPRWKTRPPGSESEA